MKRGASIILHGQGKVLMQLRDDDVPYPCNWGLFGGHVEENELPKETIIRELEEELTLKISSPLLFYVGRTYHNHEKTYFKEYIFGYEIEPDTSRLIQKEGQDKKFFSLKEIEKIKVVPWQLPIIKRFLQKNIHEA